MDLVDKHRTFLFELDVPGFGNGFPTHCGRPREGRLVIDGVGGPGEGKMILYGTDPAPEPTNPQGFQVVGRSTVAGWNGQPGNFYRFDALTFPDLRDFTMMTWKDQNFGAFATEWEHWNSPILGNGSKLMPLVDNCGVLVGYFQQGVSTDNLFATPEGEIFYAFNYASYMVTADRISGRDLWVSDAGGVSVGSATPTAKHKVASGNKADIIVDIDGYVLAINMYLDPPLWSPSDSPLIGAAKAVVGFIFPSHLPRIISEDCLPGGKREGSVECEQEYEDMLFDMMEWTFLIIDIVTLGTSAVARKAALKVIQFGARARTAIKGMKGADKARQLLLKGSKAADNATSLSLNPPALAVPAALPSAARAGKGPKLLLAGKKSGKKKNLSPVSQLAGMTNMAVRDIRAKMAKHGVRVRFRPAGSARKLRKRGAVPKWEELKMKTINDDDIALGARPSDKTKTGYFDPKNLKLPDKSHPHYEALKKRYDQRAEEFRELAEKVKQYQKDGDIVVENGVVKDGPTGKDIAGDYDIYEILDKTGKRIPPSDPRYAKIYEDLTGRRIQAQHPAHVDWNPTDPFEIKIKEEIIQRHRTTDALIEFREDMSVWSVFAD
ncbi:MAG: hypothetical protein WD872_19250 [Pirellulaceae bacterium]